ncbi:unnamed protein product [Rhizoctonia solani]|uniref:Beta-catenin-like protein 1 N-terminal domain-containing protein n=1 Tax=Rhizoctonia solani TaxID=456999 RepID=A0A8H3A4N8_9AGAM|nr:unnamed protein product [Rhizoctonia solani]
MSMKSINRFLYGPTPEEKVRAWQQKLRTEQRQLDKEIRQLDTATAKARTTVKQLATKGDVKSARILAKEVVRSNKQKDRLHVSKARLGSIGVQLQHQMAMVKVTGSLQKSTEIMKLSNSLVKLPQISAAMREMSMEMTKAGIMEEMLDETLEGLDEDEELEVEADEEVEKVLFELTDGKLGQAGKVGGELPSTEDAEEEDEQDREMELGIMDIDELFKGSKVTLSGNKRKMAANPTPEMLKRMKVNSEPASANGNSSGPSKPVSRPVTVRDEEEEEAAQNFAPGGDADYFREEDDEGRFFGGGLTDEQKQILNIFDRAGGEGAQDEEASELNTVGVRRLLSKLEKAVAKNQDQRSKYPNAPEKFIDSEADLDAAIKSLLPLAQAPTIAYPELIKSGATALLVGLLSHENMDIVIDIVEVIHEFTDEDVGGEDEDDDNDEEDEEGQVIRKGEDALKDLIDSLVTSQTLELLVQNLSRMDEKEETDRQGVFHTLGIFENVLASRPTLAETLVSTTTIIHWLLNRIVQKEHDDNRGYAAEVLSILVQTSRSNRLVLAKEDGVDTILRALNAFRNRDPAGPDETEFMENVFDALCSSLAEPEIRERFQQAEGVDLMVLIMKENRASKSRAIKVLDYALSGPLGAANCTTFVEAVGLKPLFSAFMGKSSKKSKSGAAMPASEDIGHILGVISSLFANLDSDSPPRIRVLAKFVEAEYEKIDRLVELREQAENRLKITDREINAEKKELLAAGEDVTGMEDLFLLRRLDGGLFTLQTIDVLLAWVIMEDDGIKQHVEMLFGRRGKTVKDIEKVLRGYFENIGDADAEDETPEAMASAAQRNILTGLIGFIEGC